MANEGANVKRIFLAILLLVIALMLIAGLGHGKWILFYDEPVKGYVIDAETGKPLEDAVVVSMWQLTQLFSGGYGGYAKVIEAKTGKEGRFIIPFWMTFKPWTFYSVMYDIAPQIVIYKPGYKLYRSHKIMREGYPGDISVTAEERRQVKDKYSINPAKLAPIYSDEDRAKNIMDTSSAISSGMIGDGINKKDVINVLRALDEERMSLPEKLRKELPKNE